MRIAYCTSHIAPYMASCWRALSARTDAEFHAVAWTPGIGLAPFTDALMEGVSHTFIDKGDPDTLRKSRAALEAFDPDVVVVGGWLNPAYRTLAQAKTAGARYFMSLDTPYRFTHRQRIGRYRFGRYFKSLEGVIATGERSATLARVLGFPEYRILRGMYGVNVTEWSKLHAQRTAHEGGWPKRFLYVGRLNERKGTDVLGDAYTRYRGSVSDPWPLTVCGKGPSEEAIAKVEGVDFRGFVQPHELPAIKSESAALLIPARFDPWPLVVVESCASGMPVIASSACGSTVELVREFYNGITFDVNRTDHLALAMKWMHEHHDRLPEMGARAIDMARPYASEMWAERHMQWFAGNIRP